MCYEVIYSDHLRSLEAVVNLRMKEGWQPLGAPIMEKHERESGQRNDAPIFSIADDGKSLVPSDKSYPIQAHWWQAMVKPNN